MLSVIFLRFLLTHLVTSIISYIFHIGDLAESAKQRINALMYPTVSTQIHVSEEQKYQKVSYKAACFSLNWVYLIISDLAGNSGKTSALVRLSMNGRIR
jgi:hypothetical protein